MTHQLFPKGSRIRVNSYGPFQGLKGTVHTVDTISADFDEPFCFYQIVLEGAYIQEPIWFEYDEVELVAASSITPRIPG